jgi:hypothetical protein
MIKRSAYAPPLLMLVTMSLLINGPVVASQSRPDRVDGIIVKYKESADQPGPTGQPRVTLQHTKGLLRHSKRKTGGNADIYYLDQPRTAAEARLIAQELMRRDDVE